MKPLVIVSTDGHCGCPVEQYRDYLDPKFHHLMPELLEEEESLYAFRDMIETGAGPERLDNIDGRNRIRSGGYASAWDAQRRLEELDAEGIAAEVLYPGALQGMTPFFYQFNKTYPVDACQAGVQAYHRWLAENMLAPAKGRLIGAAEVGPFIRNDLDAAIAELTFCAERGFGGVFMPGFIQNPDLPPLYDRFYEPFWSACVDLNQVVTVHAGWNGKPGEFSAFLQKLLAVVKGKGEAGIPGGGMMEIISLADENNPESVFALDIKPRMVIWQLIFSGVFDRHPDLKMLITECRADWVPDLKKSLDERFLAAKQRPNIKKKPSDYFGSNVFVSPTSPRVEEVDMRHEIGLDTFMFAADFPHLEGTWPNTLNWMQKVFHDLPENELRSILAENSIRAFGLDKAWLEGIAAKIGFKPGDILGDHPVDQAIVADWNYRSRFDTIPPVYDQQLLVEKVDKDIEAIEA